MVGGTFGSDTPAASTHSDVAQSLLLAPGMRAHRIVGTVGLALGFVVSQASAQSVRRLAALDPAVAPAPTEARTEAPAPMQSTEASVPADQTSTVPPVPSAVASPEPVVAPPPAPPATPAPEASPVTFGFDAHRKDAATELRASSLPIRSQRKLELLGEIGWNSLAGVGATLTYNAHPHLAFDLGGGLSATGWKAGVRGRYNLLTGPFTPFVGAGLSLSSGLDGARISRSRNRSRDDDFDDFDPSRTGKYDVKRSEFAQAVLGFEFIHRHGFTMQAAAGYSWLLNRNNFTFVAGRRDDHLASAFFGSGPVVSTAFGYAFD